MKSLVSLFFVVVLASFNSVAENSCHKFNDDPYEPDARLPQGPYQNQCLDSSNRRAAQLLEESKETLTVANFYHQEKWWIAQIPRNAVKDVLFQIAIFETDIPFVVPAHTQLRFKLNPETPITLIPQRTTAAKEVVYMKDPIVSFEHMAPEGVEYNLVRGQFDYFTIVGRFISTEARAKEQIVADHQTVKQIPLKVSSEDANLLFEKALKRSQANGIQKMYNTLEKNCVTELFDLLDDTLKYDHPVKRFEIHVSVDPVEGPSMEALKERKLIDESRQEPTLNDELGN